MYFNVGETLPVFDGGANSSLMVIGNQFLPDESLFYSHTHQSWTWVGEHHSKGQLLGIIQRKVMVAESIGLNTWMM